MTIPSNEAAHLAEALKELFNAPECFWFITYPAAVDGLTAEQAARAPRPRINSVWGVTLHLTLCQQFALAVLRGDPVDPGAFFAEGAWPPAPDPADEATWQQAKATLTAANQNLASCVAGLPDAALEQDFPLVGMKGYQYIHGHLAHNSHHLNEIISIRHMHGLWLEKT
jgi:hypothetical protein